MNKYTIIGTWRMSYGGLLNASKKHHKNITSYIASAISYIEEYPLFKSVGKGGLPNIEGFVEVDAGYMNGKNKSIGAIIGAKNILNPFLVSIELSKNKYNRILSGNGAEKFAKDKGFKIDKLETKKALIKWKERLKKIKENPNLNPYDGHDTVCFLGTDNESDVIAGTSTSGLFMKEIGRVGDSPLVGSGFYADSKYGAAAATGLGEDIARGVLSVKVVEYLKQGLSPSIAANKVLWDFNESMEQQGEKLGQISLIAINSEGKWGVATNCLFQFSIITENKNKPEMFISNPDHSKKNTIVVKAEDGYWEEYINNLKNRY